jgi:hypothetical protein
LALAALDGQLVNAGPFVLSKLVHVAMAVLLLLLLFKNDLDLTFGRILRALKKILLPFLTISLSASAAAACPIAIKDMTWGNLLIV